MVTQIDSRTNESSVLTLATSNNASGVLTEEKVEEVVLSEAVLAAAEEILRSREQVKVVSPWAKFCHWLAELPNELAGPPMSQQQRIDLQVTKTIEERRGGLLM